MGVKTEAFFLNRRHHVAPAPSGGIVGSYHRPSTGRKRRTQKLLSRLQIVDPALSKAPLRPCQIFRRGKSAIMEDDFSRPLLIPGVLHPIFIYRLHQHRRDYKYRRG